MLNPVTGKRPVIVSTLIAIACLGMSSSAHSQSSDKSSNGAHMAHATGSFDVELTPQTDDSPVGRMLIDKQLHGDLEATSKGQMLSCGTDVKNSGVYVAIERITGTLNGRTGTFVLQHSGTMTRGVPHLIVTVVPDSGTGELVGLTGKFDIKIVDGKHFYEFEYALPN